MNNKTEYETTPCTPIIGDIENDIPRDSVLSGDIEDGILGDMDAQLEDECLDSIWAV